ncbi:hypothetical protein [Clostridium polynesiense]|nr:hypothetical protein [Clostridium polynesiense]
MKSICRLIGKALLCVSALIIYSAPASYAGIGTEDMPQSIKNRR